VFGEVEEELGVSDSKFFAEVSEKGVEGVLSLS
jgi:hypothetical protein